LSTLDNLRREAKRWMKALQSGEAAARERLRRAYPRAPAAPVLRDVQHALAREHGFENWRALLATLSVRGAPALAAYERLAADLLRAYAQGDSARTPRGTTLRSGG
jgi:hypothetical protein